MKNRLGVLQREQVEFGRKAGLSDKDIKVYAKSKFNFLQMQEMRLALEDGIPRQEVKKRFKSNLNHEDMEGLRKEIKELEKYNEPYVEDRVLLPYYLAALSAFLIIVSFVVISFFVINNKVNLEIINDNVEVQKGASFNPYKYVSYEESGELTFNDIDTNEVGDKAVIYKLKKGNDTFIRYLTVNIVDKAVDMFLVNDD